MQVATPRTPWGARPPLAACRGARGRHRVRSGKIKTSSAERAWVLPSLLTGRASPGKAQWQLRPRSDYRRLREEWCEQAEGAGLLDGLTVYRQTRTLPGRSQEDFEIVVFQPPGQLTLDGTFGPFKARASYLLEPAASGTTLTNKWDLQPTSASLRLLGPLAIPKVKS